MDLTPLIATRAYELYEQQGHRDGQSVQNWNRAESEIQKDQAKPEPKPAKVEARSEAEIEPKVQPPPDAKIEPKTETKAKKPSDLTPQIVERVHALYEQLGREEVRAVEDLEKAEPKTES